MIGMRVRRRGRGRGGSIRRVRITNVRKDGSPFLNELTLHPVYDLCGMYRFNIGVLADAGAPVWATWKRLRASVPTCFEAELQPSRVRLATIAAPSIRSGSGSNVSQ